MSDCMMSRFTHIRLYLRLYHVYVTSTHHLEYSYKLYISNRVVLKCNRIYTSIWPREDARVVERLETLGA